MKLLKSKKDFFFNFKWDSGQYIAVFDTAIFYLNTY